MILSILSLLPLLGIGSAFTLDDLYVNNAPNSPRPYVIPHYADSHAVTVGNQLYRFFTVTGPSSDYAFTLMGTNAPGSSSLGVLPHIHQEHYENFYNLKGRFQLWAQKGEAEQEGRLLTQGDYGSVPRNTTHTFQILDPDTEMVGIIVPGGFEDLFCALGTNFSSTTNTPWDPATVNKSTSGGSSSSVISSLQKFDVYAQLDFTSRRDFVNGSAPVSNNWHAGSNELGTPGKPYFIANNYVPMYLNRHFGYQIVQPLVSPKQAQDTNYSLSNILINRSKGSAKKWTPEKAAAFEVVEGLLQIQIGDYPVAQLTTGDVAFIPQGVSYRYWSEVAFTKVLYVSSGQKGVDQQLIWGG